MTNGPSISDYGISPRGYAEFFDGIPAAIYRTTLEGKIIYCNKAFAQIFGFDSAAELIDYPVIELYRNKKDRGIFIHSILQRGRLSDLPIGFKKKDGTPILCAVSAKAVLDDDGIVVHLDGFLREITGPIEIKRDEKFQGVLEMAGGVAHSLNQPLTIVNNLLNEVVSELHESGSIHSKILKIHNQIKKMNAIAKKIGNIKKYEAMDYVAGVTIVDIDKASWSQSIEDNS
jgi:PAS domain S-box-containing protein